MKEVWEVNRLFCDSFEAVFRQTVTEHMALKRRTHLSIYRSAKSNMSTRAHVTAMSASTTLTVIRPCRYVNGKTYMEDVADALEEAKEEIFITDWW